MAAPKIALQLFSLREIYRRDPMEALKMCRAAGYEYVELHHGITYSAKEQKRMLDDAGLKCGGWHTNFIYSSPGMLEEYVRYNETIGNKYVIIAMLPGEYTKNGRDGWMRAADKLNAVAAMFAPYGIYTGLHTHKEEFIRVEETGELPWDIIAKNTDERVVLQLDMGNTAHAGVDPVPELLKYPGRYRTIHVKPHTKETGYAALFGVGDIDYDTSIKFCQNQGNTDVYVIEYEQPDAVEKIKPCYETFQNYFK